MSENHVRGIALELGSRPVITPIDTEAGIAQTSGQPVLYLFSSSYVSGGKALLRACESVREVVARREESPEWLTWEHDVGRMRTVTRQFYRSFAPDRTSSSAEGMHYYRCVFYWRKSPERLSAADKKNLFRKLEKAVALISQFTRDHPPQDPPRDADSERGLQLARERRDQLLREEKWLNAPKVHVQQGGDPDSQGINNTASRLRRAGDLLGAWNGREFLHPAFQFRPDTGRLMPEVKALLEVLPKDRSGWRQAFWLFQSHAQLDGARPADVFQQNPSAVIRAAKSDFEGSDERW